ncbi:MAG: DsbA family protein [bacterium]|nr:DsbA family protein [bacterium]
MQNKSFYWIIGVVLVFVVFLGAAAYFKGSSSNGLPIPGPNIEAIDQVRGNGKVVLMEYSDFQCPACKAYFPLVEELIKEMGDKITFVYRNFPLTQHANAQVSARAAEAAGRQGKFWEMYQKLFENQDTWAELSSSEAGAIFKGYAKDIGLDLSKFDSDYVDPNIKGKILNDYKSGINLKVEGTPTFFLNGKKIVSPQNLEEFKKVIEAAALATTGTPAISATSTVN